jgi:ABC-type branched-subunit amino acid transport system substrate-binding protein
MALDVAVPARRFFNRPEGLMLAALSGAAITLIAAAVIGGRQAEGVTTSAGEVGGSQAKGAETIDYGDLIEGPAVGPEATSGTTTGSGPGGTQAGAAAPVNRKTGERISKVGATRVGVFKDYFEFGAHGPLTFDGAPLNLADDPVTGLKGYITYLNRNGGINGLKLRLRLEDDRYTTAGGRAAADKLAKEIKPFIIEGTLGIDQIHKVALAAKAAAIPYMAGGGPEGELRDIGMYQNYTNYDEDMRILTDFICSKYGKQYAGANEIRLGTTTLNSEMILPVEKRFVKLLTDRNCVKEPVDAKARGTVNKPTEQSTYQAQLLDLRNSYGGQGANLIVPLQDPVTTARQVAENRPYTGPTYDPKWTFSNFAHDGDTTLQLVGGEWAGVRGLSPGCYYHPSGGGQPYNKSLCANMAEAHRRWISIGQVTFDENAGGSVGGRSSYNYNEESWAADGGGGAYGYQLVSFWNGAMKSIGTDPTREKFIAALNAYSNYSDLVTSPITFAGSPNRMIGAHKFVVIEGQSNLKYRQVVQITPGLVDHF